MDSLSAIQIRRAEEQMATAWRIVPTAEAREERAAVGRVCGVPDCGKELPKGDKHHVCRTCRHHGLVAAPCKGCGGRLRRLDQHGPAPSRCGYCQTCRGEMPVPLSPGCWRKGESGATRKRKVRTPEQRARESAQELARYHAKRAKEAVAAGSLSLIDGGYEVFDGGSTLMARRDP